MKCSRTKLISPYIDGELSAGENDILKLHINECRECAGELEDLQKIHELFAEAEAFKVPYGFSTRVLANITENETGRFGAFVHITTKSAEGFALLVLIVAGIILGSFLSKPLLFEKGNGTAYLSLDVFKSAPPDSVGGIYLAMTEGRNEK